MGTHLLPVKAVRLTPVGRTRLIVPLSPDIDLRAVAAAGGQRQIRARQLRIRRPARLQRLDAHVGHPLRAGQLPDRRLDVAPPPACPARVPPGARATLPCPEVADDSRLSTFASAAMRPSVAPKPSRARTAIAAPRIRAASRWPLRVLGGVGGAKLTPPSMDDLELGSRREPTRESADPGELDLEPLAFARCRSKVSGPGTAAPPRGTAGSHPDRRAARPPRRASRCATPARCR